MKPVWRTAAICLGLALTVSTAAAKPAQACNRSCMTNGLNGYIAALIAHDPAAAPIAPTLRSTENGAEVRTGEGLWKSLTDLGRVQRRYVDTVSRQAAFYGVVDEGGQPALLSLRVRFEGTRIAESEAIVARKGELLFNPAGPVTYPPRAEMFERGVRPSSRAALLGTANAYFDALGGNTRPVPKINGCERLENGTNVTRRPPGGPVSAAAADEQSHGDCTSGLTKMPIKAVAYRRFVADSDAGVILGIGLFQRPPGATWRDGSPRKRNLIHEYFVADGGKITQIFAVMHYIEPTAPDSTGW